MVTLLAADLEFRGLVHQVTDPGLLARLDGPPLVLYSGFDPTAASLALHHLMQLCTLRRFQLAGHRPIALVGGVTGMIGDPSGKTEERSLLSAEQLAANVARISAQMARFFDGGVHIADNAAWLGSMTVVELLRDVGKHFTVNQMVAKESVRARFERPDQGISYTEFSYMLLQAYDFLRLFQDHGCTLQIGGSDQWGNITAGTELVRRVSGAHVHGLTTPLVTKADGTKFGKTESGTLWLDAARTSPYRLYQFLLNTEDSVVGTYLRYFTFLSQPEIQDLDGQTASRPGARAAQRALAGEVCTLVHGREETARAERASRALFGEGLASLDEDSLLEVVEEAPTSRLPRSDLNGTGGTDGHGVGLVEVLVSSGLVGSRSEARRAIAQGGIYVNDRRVDDQDLGRQLERADLLHDRYVVLRRGQRHYHLLRFE